MIPIAVYKLGGSLLTLRDLAARLQRLFDREADHSRRLLISGGGPTADVVREWDRLHCLGEERAHWLALESLRLNESLLGELIPSSRVVRTRDEAERVWNIGGLPILCACDFVRSEEGTASLPLPHTWDVTSDSIAAWVAAVWPADWLVLLKSVSLAPRRTEFHSVREREWNSVGPPPTASADSATVNVTPVNPGRSSTPSCGANTCDAGSKPLVDPYFHVLAPCVPEVRWVNLCDESLRVELWPVGCRTESGPLRPEDPQH